MSEGLARVLYTADGEEVQVLDIGGKRILAAESTHVVMLLVDIRNELKKMNQHLEMITELEVDNSGLEDGGHP